MKGNGWVILTSSFYVVTYCVLIFLETGFSYEVKGLVFVGMSFASWGTYVGIDYAFVVICVVNGFLFFVTCEVTD